MRELKIPIFLNLGNMRELKISFFSQFEKYEGAENPNFFSIWEIWGIWKSQFFLNLGNMRELKIPTFSQFGKYQEDVKSLNLRNVCKLKIMNFSKFEKYEGAEIPKFSIWEKSKWLYWTLNLMAAWERNQNCECPPLFQFYFLLPLWTHLHHHHHHCRHHDKCCHDDKCRHHDDKCDVLLGCQRPNVLLLQQAPGLKAMSTGVLRRDHFDDLGDHINETGVMWEFLFSLTYFFVDVKSREIEIAPFYETGRNVNHKFPLGFLLECEYVYTFKQSSLRRSWKWHKLKKAHCSIWMYLELWHLQVMLEPPAGTFGTFDISWCTVLYCQVYNGHACPL